MNLRTRSVLVLVIAAALVSVPLAGAVGTPGSPDVPGVEAPATAERADLDRSPSNESAEGWVEYETIVVFRDDDPTAQWRTQEFRDLNQVFIDEQVPVTTAVVPAFDEGNPIPPEGEFCNYVRDLRENHGDIFEIAQHGYTHDMISDWKGASEFGGLSYATQHDRVTKGKAALEDCAGTTPTTFVAPGNTYDRTTARVLDDEGFDVASGSAVVADVFGDRGVFEAEGINHAFMTRGMVEDWDTPVTFYSRAELKRFFDDAYRDGDVYVQMLHFQHFHTQERLDKLRWLIDYMKSKEGVRFMTLGELSRRLDNGTAERTADGWRVRESTPEPQPKLGADGEVTTTLSDGERHVYTYELDDPSALDVSLTGDSGTDFDLYLTLDGRTPTTSDYDRRSYTYGSDESITTDQRTDGTVKVMVNSYSGSGEYTLTVEETTLDDGDDGGGDDGDGGSDDGEDCEDAAWYEFWCWFT